MGDYMIGALANAGSSFAGSIVNSLFGRHSAKEAAKRAEALAKQQRNYEIAMFNMENRYNSPENQMRLLQDAGINPASAQASFQSASAGAGAMAENVPPMPMQIQMPQLGDVMMARLNEQQISEQIKAQKLANQEKQYDLDAKSKPMEVPSAYDDINRYMSDETPSFMENELDNVLVSDSKLMTNYWDEQRMQGREDLKMKRAQYDRYIRELRLFINDIPSLKQMKSQELANMIEDLRGKQLHNDMVELDKDFRAKYGISGNENWLVALVKMMMHSPDAINNLVDALSKSVDSTIDHLLSKLTPSAIANGSPLVWLISHMADAGVTDKWKKIFE